MSSSEAPADGGGGGGEPAQSRWKAVRPWLPPCQSGSSASSSGAPSCSQPQPGADTASAAADDDCSTLSLRVIDVSSTAVALVISSPSLSHGESHRAAPLISVQLDRQPWPHVAHTSSVQPASGSDDAPRASSASWTDADRSEMAVVVYGLHPGHEYSISLDVVHGNLDDAHVLNSADIATPDELSLHISSSSSHHAAAAALASPDRDPARSASLDISAHDDDGSLPAPPPYSPAAPPPPPTETQLRATLKEIRANAKRTEGVLNASISALKKSVEKGMKEDQRSRTRMHGLEDAIRKAKDGARRMRTIDADDCDARIQELLEAEEELNDELGRRKEGSKRHSRDETSMPSPADATTPSDRAAPRPPQSTSATATTAADDDDDAPKTPATAQFNTGPSLAELSRELDGLARMLDDTEKAQRKQAKDWLRSLESELGSLEGELIQCVSGHCTSLALKRSLTWLLSQARQGRGRDLHAPDGSRSALAMESTAAPGRRTQLFLALPQGQRPRRRCCRGRGTDERNVAACAFAFAEQSVIDLVRLQLPLYRRRRRGRRLACVRAARLWLVRDCRGPDRRRWRCPAGPFAIVSI